MQSDPELKAMGNNAEPLNQEERHYLKGLRLWLVLGCVVLVTFLVLLDMSILGIVRPSTALGSTKYLHSQAIPQITTEFNSLPDVGWYIGAYNLVAYVFNTHDLQTRMLISFKRYTTATFREDIYQLQQQSTS